MGTWVSLMGWGWGRDWQELMPSASPISPCRRKQQSLEAEEARQRLKEQSIFVSAIVEPGPGSELGLQLALPPGKGFPQLGARGWEVMLCLFPGGPARGGRQAAV